jgi:hypothetical protein
MLSGERTEARIMSWYTPEEKRESIRKAREALASANATLQDAALSQRATTPMGFICKTKDDALVEPRESARSTEAAESRRLPATTRAGSKQPWWEWVDERIGQHLEPLNKVIGQAMAEWVGRKVDPLKCELELLRREFTVLQKEVAVERGLKALREEVETARAEVPKLPAIAARFGAKQADLEAEQTRLERELVKAKDRIGKLRVSQSITDYNLAELRKQTESSGAGSVELEFESTSTHFQMRAAHPAAAKALKEFATQIIDGQRDGTLWLPGPVGNA